MSSVRPGCYLAEWIIDDSCLVFIRSNGIPPLTKIIVISFMCPHWAGTGTFLGNFMTEIISCMCLLQYLNLVWWVNVYIIDHYITLELVQPKCPCCYFIRNSLCVPRIWASIYSDPLMVQNWYSWFLFRDCFSLFDRERSTWLLGPWTLAGKEEEQVLRI